MSPRAVPLESIRACLEGVIPSALATCSPGGTPNISYMSIVKYVDPERVALSRQFLNKTRANLDANPVAQVLVVDPATLDEYVLDLRHVHTETEGPVFEAMRAELEAIASQTGMGDVFRLRGADIYHVVRCEAFHDDDAPARARPARDMMGPLDELTRRLALAESYADATTTALRALEDLFDFPHAILLAADESGDRLFAVASNGYPRSGAGAEVPLGAGLIGIAAERRHVVSVANLARSRTMSAAVRDSVERGGEQLAEKEIPLPGLGRARVVGSSRNSDPGRLINPCPPKRGSSRTRAAPDHRRPRRLTTLRGSALADYRKAQRSPKPRQSRSSAPPGADGPASPVRFTISYSATFSSSFAGDDPLERHAIGRQPIGVAQSRRSPVRAWCLHRCIACPSAPISKVGKESRSEPVSQRTYEVTPPYPARIAAM